MSEPNDARRPGRRRAGQWIDALTDLGGRNTLLYYKDRRAGTLDLAEADPDAARALREDRARSGSPGCSATSTSGPTRSAGCR